MIANPEVRSQSGMSLIEALVTMTLTVILGLGVAFLSGRAAVAQKDMNVLGLAVGQMRNEIFAGNCSGVANGNTQNNLTLNLVGSGASAVSVGVDCRSRNIPLRITSTSNTSPANGSAAIPVLIPTVLTSSNNQASQSLLGGQVIVGGGKVK